MNRLTQIVILLLLLGCDENPDSVRFNMSQPVGAKSQKAFIQKLQGAYVSCNDSDDWITISENLILNTKRFEFRLHRNNLEFDSKTVIDRKNNTELIEFLKNEGYSATIFEDTILAVYLEVDTIFSISENQVLKKRRRDYFLSYKKDESSWEVSKLSFKHDSLFIGRITPSDTLLQFDFTVKNIQVGDTDSTSSVEYLLNPSRKGFKKLLKKNAFIETACYCRRKL